MESRYQDSKCKLEHIHVSTKTENAMHKFVSTVTAEWKDKELHLESKNRLLPAIELFAVARLCDDTLVANSGGSHKLRALIHNILRSKENLQAGQAYHMAGDGVAVHASTDTEWLFVVVTPPQYPPAEGRAVVRELAEQFCADWVSLGRSCGEGGLDQSCRKMFDRIRESHKHSAGAGAEVENAKAQAELENLEKILERLEQEQDIAQDMDDLVVTSKMFVATRLHSRRRRRLLLLMVACALLVTAVVVPVVLLV